MLLRGLSRCRGRAGRRRGCGGTARCESAVVAVRRHRILLFARREIALDRRGRRASAARSVRSARGQRNPADRRCGGGYAGRPRGSGATWTVRMPIACGAARLRGSSSNIAARVGVEAVGGEDRLEGGAFGFGAEARMFDAVDRIEQARRARARPAPVRHRARSRWCRRCVRPGQGRGCGAASVGSGARWPKVDVVHIGQIGRGIDAVFAASARPAWCRRCASSGRRRRSASGRSTLKRLHHPGGHPHLDLVEEAGLRAGRACCRGRRPRSRRGRSVARPWRRR